MPEDFRRTLHWTNDRLALKTKSICLTIINKPFFPVLVLYKRSIFHLSKALSNLEWIHKSSGVENVNWVYNKWINLLIQIIHDNAGMVHDRLLNSGLSFSEIHPLPSRTDITRAVIGWKSMLYESIKHRAELKLSRHLLIVLCSTFSGTSF